LKDCLEIVKRLFSNFVVINNLKTFRMLTVYHFREGTENTIFEYNFILILAKFIFSVLWSYEWL